MTRQEFIDKIRNADPGRFARHDLFDGNCWLFTQPELVVDNSDYASFKADVGDLVNVNPNCIALVGSAKYGFSMSPLKGFRPFDAETSDLDISIVSTDLFNEVWSQIRVAYYAGYTHYKRDYANQIFSRSICLLNDQNHKSTYLRELSLKLSELNRVVNNHVKIENMSNYRIYADWSDLERYHLEGVTTLQKGIAEA